MRYLLLFIFFCFVSCKDPGEKNAVSINEDNKYYSEIKDQIKDTENLEDRYSRNIIFTNTSTRQRQEFAEVMAETKIYLLKLLNRPKDQSALRNLFIRKVKLESLPIQTRDIQFIKPFLQGLNNILIKISRYQSSDINSLNWKIYSNNFDSRLKQFTLYSENNNPWRTGNRNRIGYVSIRGTESISWLISPLINLENVYNPAFSINQFVSYNESISEELKTLIKSNVINIYVSENYEYGSPDSAIWNEIPFDFNIIHDFNPTLSKKIDLSAYSGKVISIGFKFNTSLLKDTKTPIWQLNDFNLLGAIDTDVFNNDTLILKRKDPTNYVIQRSFQDGIGEFQQILSGENPASFNETERNGEKYVQINGFESKSNGVNYFISAPIGLKDLNYSLRVKQAINFYNQPAKDKNYIQILIGQNQENIDEIEWSPLSFKNIPAGDNWDIVLSEWLELNRQNQEIRIAFRYESGNGISEYPNWSIYEFEIKEQ